MARGKKTVKLKVTHGTDEVNFGTESYPVDLENDTVDVPEEAVAPLLDRGGATLVEDLGDLAPELPDGHTWIRHTNDPKASCSFGEQTFTPGPDGLVAVPTSIAVGLLSHGFELIDEPYPETATETPSANATQAEVVSPVEATPSENAAPTASPEAQA